MCHYRPRNGTLERLEDRSDDVDASSIRAKYSIEALNHASICNLAATEARY